MVRRSSALLLVAAVGLVVSSGAVPLERGGVDPVGDVALAPAPGSPYAYVDDRSGEVVVDLTAGNPYVDGDGVPAAARTAVGDVLIVHHDGGEGRRARVWLGHDSDAVSFTVDGRPAESRANAATLDPNGSVRVGLRVDATAAAAGDVLLEGVTVHATAASTDPTGREAGTGASSPGAPTGTASPTPTSTPGAASTRSPAPASPVTPTQEGSATEPSTAAATPTEPSTLGAPPATGTGTGTASPPPGGGGDAGSRSASGLDAGGLPAFAGLAAALVAAWALLWRRRRRRRPGTDEAP